MAKRKLSPAAQKFISKKIKKNVEEGKSQAQSIAIAYSQARAEGYKVPVLRKKLRKIS